MTLASLEAHSGDPHAASFDSLSDDELHVAARRLTARSNVALADLLAHLGEVESRGIHRNRACASLYTYCIYELRMSEDAAFRRAKAARLVHQHPTLRGVLARGELHLTGLLMIAPYLGGERHTEILERARFRTKREIARLIAEIDPKPAVAPRIVPIAPAPSGRVTHRALAEALAGPVRDLPAGDCMEDWSEPAQEEDLSTAERALEEARESRQAASDRPISYEVRFTASQEYVDLLEEALDLLGEPRGASRLPEVQLRALRELVERLRKRKTGRRHVPERDAKTKRGTTSAAPAPRVRAGHDEARCDLPSDAPARDPEAPSHGERRGPTQTAPAREARTKRDIASTAPARAAMAHRDAPASTPGGAQPTHGRYVPVAVRRVVWDRDGARCAYRDERGQRCAETSRLEVHHRWAHALGGPATVDNLELRCRAHNVLAAEQDFGRAHIPQMRGAGELGIGHG